MSHFVFLLFVFIFSLSSSDLQAEVEHPLLDGGVVCESLLEPYLNYRIVIEWDDTHTQFSDLGSLPAYIRGYLELLASKGIVIENLSSYVGEVDVNEKANIVKWIVRSSMSLNSLQILEKRYEINGVKHIQLEFLGFQN